MSSSNESDHIEDQDIITWFESIGSQHEESTLPDISAKVTAQIDQEQKRQKKNAWPAGIWRPNWFFELVSYLLTRTGDLCQILGLHDKALACWRLGLEVAQTLRYGTRARALLARLNHASSTSKANRETKDRQLRQKTCEEQSGVVSPQHLSELEKSSRWIVPFGGEVATAASAESQQHLFNLDRAEVRVSLAWERGSQGHPSVLSVSWQANTHDYVDFWIQFGPRDNPSVEFSTLQLGSNVSGVKEYTTHQLGFDPTQIPWAVTILLKEL